MPRGKMARPPLTELADAYHLLTTTLPPRAALAQRYGVTEYAIDVWLRQARDAKLIRPPTTGSHRPGGGHHGQD